MFNTLEGSDTGDTIHTTTIGHPGSCGAIWRRSDVASRYAESLESLGLSKADMQVQQGNEDSEAEMRAHVFSP